jgi:hypothetical protein
MESEGLLPCPLELAAASYIELFEFNLHLLSWCHDF